MNQLSLTLFGNSGPRSCLLHKKEMAKTLRAKRGPGQKESFRWVCGACNYASRKSKGQTTKDYEPTRKKYERNRERQLSASKREHYKRKYGIALDELRRLWLDQGKECRICCKVLPDPTEGRVKHREGAFHLDHCHDTGVIRGLLCNRCNMALGLFDDSPGRLEAAIRYLNEAALGATAGTAA